jgi:hypothetical protein
MNWQGTYDTLHMWTQIVGKVRTKLHPWMNHWWHAAFYVTPRGLTTGPIPQGNRTFQIDFDFVDHVLRISTNEGQNREMALSPKTVARFYSEFMEILDSLGHHVHINPIPREVPNTTPYDHDETHASYDRAQVSEFFNLLVQADRQLKIFRSRFSGKCSPVHFFWGSFDLAFSVFSGRLAPARPGADSVTREGYSHELMSWGFWPGSGNIDAPAYYAYAAPEPLGYNMGPVQPRQAFYNTPTHGYILMLNSIKERLDQTVLDFCQSTYDLGSTLGNWDQAILEKPPLKRAA